ncbi:hypothetical protein V8G54_002126 [Vigna mungo]|uniref:Reverse transcriptase domain-containing protein n=1 Tax=Vigna mungo TaxID=3915 RepID=A0AAQ3SAJ4_VIGMU
MAEATHLQAAMCEQEERLENKIISKLDERLIELTALIRQAIEASIDRRILETLHRTSESANDASGRSPNSRGARNSNSTYSYGTRLARIYFPRFGGDAIQQWIYQCETFFAIDGTPKDFCVKLAVIHFEGKALQWHTSFVKTLPEGHLPTWTDFTRILIDRFGEIDDDPMSDLMKLRQTSYVVEYHDKFDAITSRLDLSDTHLLSYFSGGLKKDIQLTVKMFQPQDLRKAFHLAKLYESASASNILPKFSLKSPSAYTNTKVILPPPKPLNKPTDSQTNQRRSNKKFTPTFMTERRSKGLCYFCDEPYSPAHALTHKKLEIHLLEVNDNPSLDPHISVNALTGIATFNTMRVTGYFKKKPLHILIDSDNTHNFLDESVAKQLGYLLTAISPLSVAMVDGAQVNITATAKQFPWLMHNREFISDMLLIPLGCYDVVLGIEWLVTLGDITWNFEKLTMQFFVQGKRMVLRGTTDTRLKTARKRQLQKTITGGPIPNSIEALLLQFDDIFQEPTTLPPTQPGHDHKIPLVTGANPINKRPYRYAKQQKDIIDKLVLCLDYRYLNKQTIKDRFPIPIVDDLLDELHGSMVFSKIDLRSRYNQVRIEDGDIHKTAFKTHGGHFEDLVMPFGLTNAPATFQGLMNDVFKDYLRHFLLVFFDDILIYSKDLPHHLSHLHSVLLTMRQNSLYAKKSKCYFGVERVEYLGHFITKEGVSTDPAKILAVQNWPIPTSLKQLRGFLGLVGYYRCFVRGYGSIARPLTNMLKKDSFYWSEEAKAAFQSLKDCLTQSPVLALPNFSKVFVVDVDASGSGIGVVLMQDHHPIAFISRVLNMQQQSLSTYEKKLLEVVFAVQKWRHYLLNRHFVIRIDHRSLQYILSQILTTTFQQKWLVKLMEFDYTIEFKQGRENVAADALSRQESVDCQAITTLIPESNMLTRIIASLQNDNELRRKDRLVVGKDGALRNELLHWVHAGSTSGHSGRDATLKWLKSVVYWRGMTKDGSRFVLTCEICQKCKYDTSASPGLLQPLPIPERIWEHITMDFIEGLPASNGKQVIYVAVGRVNKAAHFMSLKHPYSATEWAKWLPLAEWWYNTTHHTAIKCSPYEVMFGQPPPPYLPYLPRESKKREEALKLVKFHMKRAQDRMKQLAYRRGVTDPMILLHPYRQISVAFRSNAKLAPKFFGPFQIVDQIGVVAYKLRLPQGSKIHDVFHILQLRRKVGHTPSSNSLPAEFEGVMGGKEPEEILDRTTVKRGNKVVTKVLMKCKHQLLEDTTWEYFFDLKKKYPNFNP